MDLGDSSFDYPFVRWCAGWDLNPQSHNDDGFTDHSATNYGLPTLMKISSC